MINLFDKRVNGFLTKMDDSTSMVSLALRDGVESSGRTYMEYKRDKHGGRERLIEEGATMVIWAFGINWMKGVYDWVAKDAMKKIDLPDLNTALLKKSEAPGQQTGVKGFFQLFNTPSAQTLVDHSEKKLSQGAQNLVKTFEHNQAYGKLTDIVSKQSSKYAISNMAKFLIATGIPVTAIAFGIPSFNQWLTRKKLAQEKKSLSALGMNHTTPAAAFNSPFNKGFNQPVNGFAGFPQPGTNALNQNAGGNPFFPNAFSAKPATRKSAFANGKVQFGGGNIFGDAAAALLQNERMNTLLVDSTISGGRIYKGRNWQEKAEIIFREGSIIALLYFGQSWLQKRFTQWFKGGSNLSFDATRFLNGVYGKPQHQDQFKAHFEQAKKDLHGVFGTNIKAFHQGLEQKEGGKFWENLFTYAGRDKIRAAQASHYEAEKKLVAQIQHYFESGKAQKGEHNLIFEVAKECGWIPTFDGKAIPNKSLSTVVGETFQNAGQKVKNSVNFLKGNGGEFELAGNRFLSPAAESKALNITKKIDTDSIFHFVKHLEEVLIHNEKSATRESVQQLMKKAIGRRAWAWVASNAVCTLFLSYLCPKVQHYITYRNTGKNYFPGVQPTVQ